MKRTAIYTTFAAALLFTACGNETSEENTTEIITEAEATGEGNTYEIVKEQSSVNWHGTKVTGEHRGEVKLESGQFTFANDQLTGGKVVMDMTSITNTDLTDQEQKQKLEGHLKSEDFFGVEKHPTATFEVTGVSPIENATAGSTNYNIQGNLTIKENTNPVSFPATITKGNGVINAKADMTVDRSKFDVRYGSETFFGNLGDKAISDNFTITLDITAKQ
jgi:polyisoprenoid-binding protein YceI